MNCTQIFVIGDPLARPLAVVFANGETARARQWFQDTDLAEVLEIADRHGRVKEVLHTQLNAGTDQGIPYDLVTRSRRGFWAQTGLAAKEAVLRGTGIPLFAERNGRRIYYDLDKPYPAPWLGDDPQGQLGLALSFGGQNRSNVLALFQARLGPQPEGSPLSGELVLLIDEVDPLSLYDHRVSRQAWSRSGDLLEELTGHIPRLRPGELASPAAISNALSRFQPATRFQHRYRRG